MNKPGFDVAACLRRVQGKDEEAARDLLNHLHPLVLKLVRGHLPRRTSEEDLVQTVFMKIFTNLDQYSGAVPVEHWVSRITINTCINQIKAEQSRPEVRWADLSDEQQFLMETLAATNDELDTGDALAAREIVEKLLAGLDPGDALLLRLLHLEGRSPKEVAQLTGWSDLRVRVRAFRARQKLKSSYRRLMFDVGDKL